jgi:hypothetical protein
MLTKNDLQQIGSLIDNKLDKKLEPLKKDLATMKKDTSQTRKDVKVLIAYFDREYIEPRKRIDRIEEHLGISDRN